MNRIPVPIPKTFEESDYPDHHMAKVRCRSCATTWDAVYPKVANVAAMECYNCHAKDSEVAKYHKYIYKN
jgi:hypothetical protein